MGFFKNVGAEPNKYITDISLTVQKSLLASIHNDLCTLVPNELMDLCGEEYIKEKLIRDDASITISVMDGRSGDFNIYHDPYYNNGYVSIHKILTDNTLYDSIENIINNYQKNNQYVDNWVFVGVKISYILNSIQVVKLNDEGLIPCTETLYYTVPPYDIVNIPDLGDNKPQKRTITIENLVKF